MIDLVSALDGSQIAFLAINCAPPFEIINSLEVLSKAWSGKLGVYANGLGCPDDTDGWTFPDGIGEAAAEYVEAARKWQEVGASVIGGCCGTTPEYIKSLKSSFSN